MAKEEGPPSAGQLLSMPLASTVLEGTTLNVSAWRDYMPPAHSQGSGLMISIDLHGASRPASPFQIEHIWVIHKDEVWEEGADISQENNRRVVRGGPSWPVGDSIVIVAEVASGRQRWKVRSAPVVIGRTD